MVYLLLSFLAGAIIGGIVMYFKGKRDGLQLLSDEILEDIKRKDQRAGDRMIGKMKKHMRNLV
jgi:membrane protein DedA with SNARE-associated domain